METGDENCSGDWGGKLFWRLGRKSGVEIGEENSGTKIFGTLV